MHSTAIENDLKRLQTFVNKNQQNATDNNGYTALHYASRNGHYHACEMLLKAGANVNATTTSGGVTSLMRASMMGELNNTIFYSLKLPNDKSTTFGNSLFVFTTPRTHRIDVI